MSVFCLGTSSEWLGVKGTNSSPVCYRAPTFNFKTQNRFTALDDYSQFFTGEEDNPIVINSADDSSDVTANQDLSNQNISAFEEDKSSISDISSDSHEECTSSMSKPIDVLELPYDQWKCGI